MSSENICNFPFSAKSIHDLFKKINATEGRYLIAIKITNIIPIRAILEKNVFQDLLKELRKNISKFFMSQTTDFVDEKLAYVQPFFFATISSEQNIKEKIYELEDMLNVRNYSYEDFQLAICYKKIEESFENIFKQSIASIDVSEIGCGIIPYEEGVMKRLHDEYTLLSRLKSALRAKLARFAYQPIINCSTGSTAYYECLMRIPDENGELISAGKVIVLSEKYGLINHVDRAVVDLAVKELKANDELMLAINISNVGLLDERLENVIKTSLSDRKHASRLIIEITETAINNNFERISQFIDTVKNLGCKVAIDDFGSGATSLSHLKNLKFDILKIDGSLTRNMLESDYNMYLVKTIIALAQEVRAKTVAEFVENGRIAKFLMDCGIDYMQGNFFAPAQNFRTWSNN